MDGKRIAELLGTNVLTLLKIAKSPRLVTVIVREKLKMASDLIDWLVWGFGERPGRVFWAMAVLIAAFAARYYTGTNDHLRGNWVEATACSLYNFATIGCDYRGRFDSVEGIIGAILLGSYGRRIF